MDIHTTETPAEIYDRLFVPALFQHWGKALAEHAAIGAGMEVLDIACGTGALTREVVKRVEKDGKATGLDINDEMLDVARAKHQGISWHQGSAENLPFENQSFDAVLSQFGFMFFDDQPKALREMQRVLRPGGRLCVAVCDAIDHSPGYAVLAELLNRLFGYDIAQAFRAPFTSGDRHRLEELCSGTGLNNASILRLDGPVRFSSIKSLIATERACVWTLGGLMDDSQFERLLEQAEESLHPFLNDQGEIEFNMPVLVIDSSNGD